MNSLKADLKLRIRNSKPYQVFSAARWAYRDMGNSPIHRVFRLEPKHPTHKGRVLLSYHIQPFLVGWEKPVQVEHPYYWHPAYWESTELARSFLELGYGVDVISHENKVFVPRDEYAVFLDVRHNMERLTPLLPTNCLKIFHIDSGHMIYHNAAESKRLLDVQRRRRVTLQPRRFEKPNLGIDYADCATMLGNEFTASTFAYAGKRVYPLHVSTPVIYPWPEGKDFNGCRRNFMWLGSGGMVHKGLDLALEAFAEMPDLHLTVCGPVSQESDFEAAYRRELYQLPNIQTVGWVDMGSQAFLESMRNCIALIYPSSCEGQSCAVVAALAGSLIPIISYQSGVDVQDFGTILRTCSVPEIREQVRDISCRPATELERMARRAWEYTGDNHSRVNFARELRQVLHAVMVDHAGEARVQAPVAVAAR